MQNLEIFVAYFDKLIATIINDPVASAAIGAFIGALIILLLSLFLLGRSKKKYIRLREETNREHKSLTETIALKSRHLDITKQICEEQKGELATAKAQIARLEESAKQNPILEEKIEQQLRQIEALTETISNELNVDNSTKQSLESMVSKEEAAEPISKQAVIDHLSTRLYRQLSTLHKQITDQSHLISELQTELNAKKESITHQIIAKSQQLPRLAKTRFGERVIEPIHMRVDELKQSVQSIPLQTRAKIDQLVMDPIYRRVHEIKSGMSQIPGQTAGRLNKVMVDPLNELISGINRSVKNLSVMAHEKFNHSVTGQLQGLVSQFKKTSGSLSTEMPENLNRTIIQPLGKLLAEIKKITGLLPKQSGDNLNEVVIRPAK